MLTMILSLFLLSFSAYAASESCEPVSALKADPENPHNYYECTNVGWQIMPCAADLVFNETISQCDDIADPCEPVSALKADPKNPHNFYECTSYGWQLMPCAADLVFNETKSQCDDSAKPCEPVSALKPDPENPHNFYECTSYGWQIMECAADLVFNETKSQCDWPDSNTDSCDPISALKADPENCHNFYECTNNGWQIMNCPTGLVFNEDTSVCDWPTAETNCGNDTIVVPCDTVGELKPDTENCLNYYQCTTSGWEKSTCPTGYFFNNDIQVCDLPKQGTTCEKNDDNDDDDDDDDDDDSDLDPCKTAGDKKADTKRCELYYVCTSCGWSLKPCDPGYLFNPKTLTCDVADQVVCAKDDDLEPCDKLGELKPDPIHCELYYKCSKCGWALVECGSGLLFNPETLTCDLPANVKCAKDDKLEPCDTIGELKPMDSDNCDQYYKCTKKGWGPLTCASGLRFNPKTLACENADQVTCENDNNDDTTTDGNDNVPTAPTTDGNNDGPTTDGNNDGPTTDGNNDGPTTDGNNDGPTTDGNNDGPTTDGNNDGPTTDGNNDGPTTDGNNDHSTEDPLGSCTEIGALKPDPKNCHRFDQCTPYGWQNMPCYDGLVFNPNTKQCDYDYNVDCVNQ